MSKTRFVAFATQKGGIGKSTITALVANYFHNVKGYNVAVIDCDEPQYNLADLRDEELELIKSSDYFKAQACEHFKKLGKKSFSVTRSNAVNALDDAETVLNETEVKLDFIFFDMPGTIKSEGVMKTLSQMDYIFVPVGRPLCCRKRNELHAVVPRQLFDTGLVGHQETCFLLDND